MGRRRAVSYLVASASLAGLAIPAESGATVTCNNAGDVVTVTMSQFNDTAMMSRTAGGAIQEHSADCGTATVANTNTIQVTDTSGSTTYLEVLQDNGGFVGGTPEGSGQSEIEFRVDLGTGTDFVSVTAASAASANFRAGTSGINYNSDESPGDADITDLAGTAFPSGVENLYLSGSNLSDALGAQGALGTGSILTQRANLAGFGGTNVLVGGDGDDSISGGPATDTIAGNGGADYVAYLLAASSSITVDLRLQGAFQDTGGAGMDKLTLIEGVTGSNFSDTFTGDDGPNKFLGGGAGDTLIGGGGRDEFYGEAGGDSIFARDGVMDFVDCGSEADTVETDAVGIDGLIACETQLFAPSPVIASIANPTAAAATFPKKCKKGRKLKKGKCRKKKKH
jgi:Ca2+-binding RTX toxin-like protein